VHGLAQDSRGLSHHHVAILRQRQRKFWQSKLL
jgi:hypothetical protein